jgi:hypothetical protein
MCYCLLNQLRNRRQERDASIGLDIGTIPSSMLRNHNNPRKFKLRWEAGPDETINQVTESIRVSQKQDFYLLPCNPIEAWRRGIARFS